MRLAPARLRLYLRRPDPTWPEVVDAGRTGCGKTTSTWSRPAMGEACLAMGREQAAIALAVVSTKDPAHFRTTAGGYFHGMVAKAKCRGAEPGSATAVGHAARPPSRNRAASRHREGVAAIRPSGHGADACARGAVLASQAMLSWIDPRRTRGRKRRPSTPIAIRRAVAPEPRGSKALRSAGHRATRHEGVRGRVQCIEAGGQRVQLPSKTRPDPLAQLLSKRQGDVCGHPSSTFQHFRRRDIGEESPRIDLTR